MTSSHDIVRLVPAKGTVTVVTERGQTSIPSPLRRELGLSQGQRLLWERTGERELRVIVLEPEPSVGAKAMLGFARRFRTDSRSTEEWMAELRAGESPVEDSE